MRQSFTFFLILFFSIAYSQDKPKEEYRTFKDTRVINTQSAETLPARKMDFRVSHRFGDLAGSNGGWPNFYGLEDAADVLIGIDYGITDRLTVGLNRSKGAGPLTQLVNGTLKFKLVSQSVEEGAPFTLSVLGGTSLSTVSRIDDPNILTSFPRTIHRLIYNTQLLFARKFSEGFSLQISPGYVYRNLVLDNDENGLFNLGFAARLQITKVFGVIVDTTIPFSELRTSEEGFYIPLGFGLEIDTGGHVFQINLTNATGLAPTDYIPNTRSNWLDGEFRLGFTISRLFNL